jgi:hypothetical protein
VGMITVVVSPCQGPVAPTGLQTLPFVTLVEARGLQSPMAVVPLEPGCTRVRLGPRAPATPPGATAPPLPYPFPPAQYPATLVARDDVTAGDWVRVHGRACVSTCGRWGERGTRPPVYLANTHY